MSEVARPRRPFLTKLYPIGPDGDEFGVLRQVQLFKVGRGEYVVEVRQNCLGDPDDWTLKRVREFDFRS